MQYLASFFSAAIAENIEILIQLVLISINSANRCTLTWCDLNRSLLFAPANYSFL